MSVPNDYKTEPTRTCCELQQKLPLRAGFEFLLALSNNLKVARGTLYTVLICTDNVLISTYLYINVIKR